jgi:hypothetical protein
VLFARAQHAKTIAFGHHLTDAVASLLKSTLMYVDRWTYGHEKFCRVRFSALVDSCASEFDSELDPSRNRLFIITKDLISKGLMGTDEPPLETIEPFCDINIVRPMYNVPEDCVISFASAVDIRPEGSGCGHGATTDTETPRETVHRRLLRRSSSLYRRNAVVTAFGALLQPTLTPTGRSRVHTRHLRAALLGKQYKPGPADEEKLVAVDILRL